METGMDQGTGPSDAAPRAKDDETSEVARQPLTRVPFDPPRTMEPAIEWCRHEVRRLVAWRLVGNAAVVLAVIGPLTWWRSGSAAPAIAIGCTAALVTTLCHIGIVLVAGPLGFTYLKRFTAAPPEYSLVHATSVLGTHPVEIAAHGPADLWDLDPDHEPPCPSTDLVPFDPTTASTMPTVVVAATDDDPNPERRVAIAAALSELGLSPVATVRADRLGRTIDLFTDGDRIVVAADRTDGSVTVLTELPGFRVLISSALLIPPTDDLVVNVVRDAYPARLVLSHQRLVEQAFRSRARVSEPVGLFKLAQHRELEAYRELGPFWSAMLDLRCRPSGARLVAAPLADDVLLFSGNRFFQHP